MRILLSIFFVLSFAACAPVLTPVSPITSTKSAKTQTVSPSSTVQITPSKTASPPVRRSTSTPVTPKIEILAPNPREVALKDLGLSPTTRLLLYYEPSESLRSMSATNDKPIIIPNTARKASFFFGITISPDQKWFAYQTEKEQKGDDWYYDEWISSIDGKEQKRIASDVQSATDIQWPVNEQILFRYHLDGSGNCPQLQTAIINPFTQKTENIDMPDAGKPDCFFKPVLSPDHTKMIHKTGGYWQIYNFQTKQNESIFPLLSTVKDDRFLLLDMKWLKSGITVAMPNEKSIDFIVDLPSADVSNPSYQLNQFLLPENGKIYNTDYTWRNLEKGLVGFDVVASDYDYYQPSFNNTSPSSNFMILDLRKAILFDYQLDRAKVENVQRYKMGFIQSSIDGQFLAWTVYTAAIGASPLETVVLNRITGQIARIKGFEFYGWGEIAQP